LCGDRKKRVRVRLRLGLKLFPHPHTKEKKRSGHARLGQSDNATTGLDPEDNQETLQQESATEVATMVPISYHSIRFSMGPS